MGSRGAHCTVAHEVEHIHVHSDTDWRWDGAIVGCPVKGGITRILRKWDRSAHAVDAIEAQRNRWRGASAMYHMGDEM